jgi:hypothetical protein
VQGPDKRFIALGPGGSDHHYVVHDQDGRVAVPGAHEDFEQANAEAYRLNRQVCANCGTSPLDGVVFTPASLAIGLCAECREARELDIRDGLRSGRLS